MARQAGGDPALNNFVAEALQKRNNSYEELKSILRECRKRVEQEPDSEEAVNQLVTLIGSITANVSCINERKHESVVSDVLGIKLWNATPAVLAAVLDFTRNLVVANSAFTHTCLQLIVYSFTPPPGSAVAGDPSQDPHGPWRPSEQALAVHQSLLAILSRVLGLVPTAPTNVLPLIVAQMPHKLRDRNTQCLYLSALFRISEDRAGAPIREALLTAVVEHLMSLDVEIKWEDIVDVPTGEEEEEQDDGANEDVFELEEMLASELDINAGPEELARRHAILAMRQGAAGDGRGGWEGAVAGGGHGQQLLQQQPASTRPPVDEMANKMDSMMELAFEHLEKRIAAGDLRQTWETLLSAFERTILNTHRSKFTQFLLFYACIHNPSQCSQSLVRLLLTRLRDPRQPPITRTACAAYLASFLARAAFVPDAVVVKALQDLATFCVEYCKSLAASGGGLPGSGSAGNLAAAAGGGGGALMALNAEAASAHTQRHQIFYAAVQAVLYVLCYHMQSLVGDLQQQQQQNQQQAVGEAGAHSGGGKERKELADAVLALVRGPVWQLLNHRLQPLGACLPSVAAEFVHQAASQGVADCTSLLTQVEPSTRSQRPLEMFFPFDPYLLRRSSRFLKLKQSYVRWRHGHPQAAAAGGGAEAVDSDDDDVDEADERGSENSEGEDHEPSSSSSEQDDDDGEDSDDEDMAGRSMPSDAMLHDPTHRLHGGGAMPLRHHHHHHHHHHARGVAGSRHGGVHGRGRGTGGIAMGTSYMSYASTETASQGDGGGSPYGMSPHDGGDMLVNNPLGSSPGVVPMSLGTPEMHFISQVPLRIGRR